MNIVKYVAIGIALASAGNANIACGMWNSPEYNFVSGQLLSPQFVETTVGNIEKDVESKDGMSEFLTGHVGISDLRKEMKDTVGECMKMNFAGFEKDGIRDSATRVVSYDLDDDSRYSKSHRMLKAVRERSAGIAKKIQADIVDIRMMWDVCEGVNCRPSVPDSLSEILGRYFEKIKALDCASANGRSPVLSWCKDLVDLKDNIKNTCVAMESSRVSERKKVYGEVVSCGCDKRDSIFEAGVKACMENQFWCRFLNMCSDYVDYILVPFLDLYVPHMYECIGNSCALHVFYCIGNIDGFDNIIAIDNIKVPQKP